MAVRLLTTEQSPWASRCKIGHHQGIPCDAIRCGRFQSNSVNGRDLLTSLRIPLADPALAANAPRMIVALDAAATIPTATSLLS